jgi:hypothetical protein
MTSRTYTVHAVPDVEGCHPHSDRDGDSSNLAQQPFGRTLRMSEVMSLQMEDRKSH